MTTSRQLACLSAFLLVASGLVAGPAGGGMPTQMGTGSAAQSTPPVQTSSGAASGVNIGMFDPTPSPGTPSNPLPTGNHGPAAMPGMSPKYDTSMLPTDIKTMIVQFSTLRDKLMADRQAMIAKLKGVSDAQRKQIIADFLTTEKSLLDQQKTLAKQIRDEVRTLRRNTGGPGPQ